MILLGETSELSLEPTIESRFDRSICVVPSGVAKKCVGADPSTNHCDDNQQRCSLHRRELSVARGRTVRDLEQGSGSLPDEPDGPRL
jgi:hypothetical protein